MFQPVWGCGLLAVFLMHTIHSVTERPANGHITGALCSDCRVMGISLRKPNTDGNQKHSNIAVSLTIYLLLCVRKASYDSSYKRNSFLRKRLYSVDSLVPQRVSLVCVLHALGSSVLASFSIRSYLQRLSLSAVGSVWSLARMWWVLTGCGLLCLINDTWYHLH